MPPVQSTVRSVRRPSLLDPSLLAPIAAMLAMAALVVTAALLGLREAAIDMNPNSGRIALADPWPYGLVTLFGWLMLERVAPALREALGRPGLVMGVLMIVRVTLSACLILVLVGPAAQALLDLVS